MSAVLGPRGFALKLYLDCISQNIKHKSICITGSAAAEDLEEAQVFLLRPLVPPGLSSFTDVLKSQS